MGYCLGIADTDRGRRLTITREIAAPAATVWTLLSSVIHWPAWGPPVTDVEYPHERVTADTTGRVQALGLVWVPFRIEAVGDSDWTWTAWGRTPPADGHRVEDAGDDRCRAVLECPLWAPWYLPLCALALRNIAVLATRDTGRDGT